MAKEPTPTPEAVPETPPERPEWLLERFENTEAQAKAYADAQAEMNRLRAERDQERQSFTAALEGLQQAPPPPTNGAQGYDPALSAYTQAWEAGDMQGMLAAQAQYTLNPTIEAVGRLIDEKLSAITPAVQQAQAAQREHDLRLAEGLVERMIGADEYAALGPRVRELVADHPHYLPQATSVEGYRDAILDVVKLAQYDTHVKTIAELERERSDKLAAQTLSGGFNRSPADQDAARAEFERIKGTPTGSFQELMDRARTGG